ncbi:MAG: helix-turn-helix domain-containing protein [Acidimicrobiales bacterium]
MATREARTGLVGQRLAANLRALRDRVPVRELSKRMAEIGRPIVPSGITKIEKGERRVDVDDLVALALALDTTPNRLLLDGRADESAIELSGSVKVSRRSAWRWATGEQPLPNRTFDTGRYARFWAENRPHEPGDATEATFEQLQSVCQPVLDAIRAVCDANDVTTEQVLYYLDSWRSLQQLLIEAAQFSIKQAPQGARHEGGRRHGTRPEAR